ncbi:TolC family protein [Lacinutrix sp. C3R15]|uniref:TolC family protein n=1 Tax=Flavobacteriaceae TaxID=49546 RepID=UPI001C0991A1|nr:MULTISPECIES: TolC family protein [Flavobacteriaceae]MBU2940053.1 TolC family protein [Lacinutrix sp. C3R15]MDO6623370.1 TolC family protein [Oceanihabitans sp. 1_MG-2023]
MKKLIFILLAFLSITTQAQDKKWTLQECVEYALDNNISVKQSELDLQNTELNKKDAFGNFLPSLNASVNHSWNIGLNQDPVTFDAVNSTTRNLSGGISSGVNIYNGLRNVNQLRRSNLEILASQYQLDNIKDNMSLNIANAFLQILFNKEQLKVLQAQQEISQQELQRTNDLVEAGALPRGDLLEIQATIATQEQQVVNAENAILLSKISLAQLLLLEDYETFDIVDNDYQVPPTSILNQSAQAIITKAKEVRYDIKIAENNSEIAQYNLKIAKGALQPTLSGSYSFGTNYFKSQLFDTPEFTDQVSDNKSHGFSLSLSIPIFNGFSVKNNVKRNEINVLSAQYQLEQANLDLETNVYQAYNDAKGALKAYEAALKTEEARSLAFNYSQERYNVGMLNAFDFNQSKNRLENAQSEVVRTKYDYIFKLKVLEFYFGIPITALN